MSRRQRNNREERLHHRARGLVNATTEYGVGFPLGNQWLGNHGRTSAWLAEHGLGFIRDICLLKGINPRRGQDKRRDTLTGARLNAAVIKLGEPVPPDGYEFARQIWDVADDPAIAAERRLEEYECDYIAARFGFNVTTERARVEDLNLRHEAWLESITGKIIEVADDKRQHPAGLNQDDAIGMAAEDIGFNVFERRNRHNDLLEGVEKRDRRGKRYRPNKAGPCRTLTGDELIAAIATLRPSKKGWPYRKPEPRGNEPCLFDQCRRAKRKPLEKYAAYVVPLMSAPREVEDYKPELGRSTCRVLRKNKVRVINVPTDWQNESFAEELMTFRAKKPLPHEWGETLFGNRLDYGAQSLLRPIHVDRTSLG
jgi:hypothetical protein